MRDSYGFIQNSGQVLTKARDWPSYHGLVSITFNTSICMLTLYAVASDHTISQTLSLSSESESTMGFLLEKYEDCRVNHIQCNLPKQLIAAAYPSRLLYIGTEQHSSVVLRSTTSFHDEVYACLSHCWGDTRSFSLNAETLSALVQGIDVAALPKTYQDAILVTRRLRIQYLWIDSLYVASVWL
jgi:hypothetical protein